MTHEAIAAAGAACMVSVAMWVAQGMVYGHVPANQKMCRGMMAGLQARERQ